MSTRRRFVLSGAAAIGGAVAAACTGPGGGEPPAATTHPAQLSVMSHSAGEEPAFKAMFEEFKKKRPEITVDFSTGGTGGANAAYNEKIVSLVAAGSAPDVFKTAPFGFGQLAHNGAYLALDDYVKKQAAEVKPDDFFPSHYEGS